MKYNFDSTLDHRYDNSYRWAQPEGRDDILGMGTADMDFECPPCVKESALGILEENTFNYRAKTDRYYDSLVNWYKRMYGLEISKDWHTNIPATLGAVRLILGCFTKPGDKVIMQAPYFSPLVRAAKGAGCEMVFNPMILSGDRYELDFDDFEKKVKEHHPSVFILVNPQNPTGRVFTREELERMVRICHENGVKIISDEVHSLVLYGDRKHIPLLAISDAAKNIGIQVMAMSKAFNTMSLPHAIVLMSDPELRKAWSNYIIPFDFHYATNTYAISAFTAIAEGQGDEWLEQVTDHLKDNLDHFMSEVKRRNIPIRPMAPEAGYLLWIDCRDSGLDQIDLAKTFHEKAGISLNDGLEFGEEGRGFVRMNFAVTREHLDEAIDRIEKMFR